MEEGFAGSGSTGKAVMGKRKQPMPIEEEPRKAMRMLSPEEIESHREFLEDEEPGDTEMILRFLPAAAAEQIRSVFREMDVKKLKQRSRELLGEYAAKGYAEVPVPAFTLTPSPPSPPSVEAGGRVSEARVAGLRRFMERSFHPIPERVLRSRFFSEAQAEVMRNFNRVFLKAEAELKAHIANALEEYDAKGYLECTAEGKIKVSKPRCGSSTT